MGGGGDDPAGAAGRQQVGRGHDGAAGVDHVVDQHAGAAGHLADDLLGLHQVLLVLGPALVDDGQVGVQDVGVALGHLDPARVGRHDHQILLAQGPQVVHQHGHGGEMVDGAVEEALDLARVQVHRHQPLGPGRGEQVGQEPGRDGLPARGLAVLAGVAVERGHHRDALGRGPLGRVHHDELLHDHVVDGHGLQLGVGLDDEHVEAPDRLAVADVDLAVGELVDAGRAQLHPQLLADGEGQVLAGPAGHHVQLFVGLQLHAHAAPPLMAASAETSSLWVCSFMVSCCQTRAGGSKRAGRAGLEPATSGVKVRRSTC